MKKLFLPVLLFITCAISAQTPIISLDFEEATFTLPTGITAVDGGVSVDADGNDVDLLATEPTTLEARSGSKSLQMANRGYLMIDAGLISKDFTITFSALWTDPGAGSGDETDDGAVAYGSMVAAYADVDGTLTAEYFLQSKSEMSLYFMKKTTSTFMMVDTATSTPIWADLALTVNVTEGTCVAYFDGAPVDTLECSNYVGMESSTFLIGSKFNEKVDGGFSDKIIKDKGNDGDTPRAQGFCGYMDNINIYNMAMSTEEVAALYSTGTSVDEIVADKQFSLHNSNSQLTIKMNESGAKQVTVYSVSGAMVYSTLTAEPMITTPKLDKGFYVVSVQDESGQYGQKVVID